MRVSVSIIFCLAIIRSLAQDFPRGEVDISQIADELYAQPDADLNYEDLYENLAQLLSNPIQLNTATVEELRFLKVLSESQINALITYRTESGKFISVYELQAIPEFDLTTVYRIVPFVTLNDANSTIDKSLLNRIRKEADNYFLVRYERTLETKRGSTDTSAAKFLGTPDKLYLRFRSSRPGDFSMGFTAEKDQGEQIKWNPSQNYYGADYFSYHVQLQNKGRIKNLIVGDFQSQFGQGLMLGGVFGTGKGGETITTSRRSNIGVLPYTSVYEAGGLRGVGVSFQASMHLTVTAFFSKTKRDANVEDADEEKSVSSFQTTGLHRNRNELDKRKAINEKNWGVIVGYKRNAMDVGIMFNQINFSGIVTPKQTPYNQFAFKGNVNQNVGIYANYTFQHVTLFSEAARSLGGGYASTVGLLTSIAPKFDVSLLYRNYQRNFYAFSSSGFAESSNTQNEQGIYWGWKYSASRKVNVSGYFDAFRFPWLRFRSYAPSDGYEWLVRFAYEPSRKVKTFIQFREEVKDRNVQIDSTKLYNHVPGRKRSWAFSFDYSPHTMLRFKSRAQLSSYNVNAITTHGIAIMQDIIIDVGKLKITARYGVFDTNDFDNRQYSYENDVWLAYSLPAYYGVGVRKMAIVEYKFSKHIGVWIRYAHVRYENQEAIGSGMDLISGKRKNDIKVQLVVRF